MNILNKNGDLIKCKVLTSLNDYRFYFMPELNGPYFFQVNTTNIFVLEKNSHNIEIYDFNLELVHSIDLDPFYNSFHISNYDLAFLYERQHDEDNSFITVYNYKTAEIKSQTIYLDDRNFMNLCLNSNSNQELNCFELKFLNFNQSIVLLEGNLTEDSLSTLFILNRNDNYNVVKYLTNINLFEWCKFYNSDMYMLYSENYNFMFKIYDTNSLSADAVAVMVIHLGDYHNVIQNDKFILRIIYPTSNYKYILNRIFFSNKKIIKFSVY